MRSEYWEGGYTLSGRLITIVVLVACVSCASFALWQRSRNTSRIRYFWTPRGAWLIQHAPLVQFGKKRPKEEAVNTANLVLETYWRDVSNAPGLIHLRATLVDDRYFDWTTLRENTTVDPDNFEGCRLIFEDLENRIVISLEEASGIVRSDRSPKSVQLIDSSRQAISSFLSQWQR